MKILRAVSEIRAHLQQIQRENKIIGMVPTMGALHRGHGVLIEQAHSECPHVVVSIFVNPLQFGPTEDYGNYPRSFDGDVALCEEKGASVVFAPDAAAMYPSQQITFVEVTGVSEHLCGAFRPGHFRAVATVVSKLFNIVQPDRAYFGEKDFQQLCVIRRMVEDLNMPIQIVGVPTVREPDGLALSSRNAYLNPEERRIAPVLFVALQMAARLVEGGETNASNVKAWALERLSAVRVEYFEVVDPSTVQPVEIIQGPVRIAAAIWLGNTRLIDNVSASGPYLRS